jgi:hypothetical protein
VTDGEGKPVPECVVDRVPMDRGIAVEEIAIMTDEEGRFEMRLAEGEWTLKFLCSPDPNGSTYVVPVRPGDPVELHVEIPLD